MDAIGLAQTCFDLTRAIVEYLEAVKGAPAERLILANEMQNIGNLAQLLMKLGVLDPGHGGLDAGTRVSDEISGPLRRMVKRMNDIRDELAIDPESKRDISHLRQKVREIGHNLKWPFKQEQVIGHLNALERDKSIMTLYLQGHNYMLSRDTQETIGDVQTDLAEVLDTVRIIGDQVGNISLRDLNNETRDLLRWLSPLDFASRQRQLCAYRRLQDQTGAWFLDTPQVRTWLAGDRRLLYATGVAGSGKTMLASITIEHLRLQMPDTPIAFAFFDHKSQGDYSVEALLASVLRQLLQSSGEVPESLRRIFERSRGTDSDPPSLEDVLASLKTVLSNRDVYIVLDAIDEFSAQASDRQTLLDELLRLDTTESMQVMVTCRTGQASHKDFEGVQAVKVKAHAEDVRSYLRPRVHTSMPHFILQSDDLKTQIIEGISAKVQDMFVLAQYHLQAVGEARNPKGLLRALDELPTGSEGLDQLYGRCLARIDQQSAENRDRLYRMLDLLVCSRRSLTPLEVVEALALDTETITLDQDDRVSIEDLVIDAEGLVMLDDKGEAVGFTHETVHKYLSTRDRSVGIEARVAELCMGYLSLKRLRKKHYDVKTYWPLLRKQQHPFFKYAATYWGEHAKQAIQKDAAFVDKVMHFLAFPYRACDGWTGKLIMESSISRGMAIWKGHDFDRGGHQNTIARARLRLPPIQHAVYFGLFSVVRRLLDECVDVNAIDPQGNFLTLNAAVQSQRVSMAKLLLERGANPNIVANGHAPLNWAAESSSLEMVQLLVEHGANVDLDNQRVDPPLCTACERDRKGVAEYLIQAGADLDNCVAKPTGSYRTPLSYVLDKGRPKCRELLLFQRKALTPERGPRLLMPMEDAELVQRLIGEVGTSPHQTFGLGHNALDVALRLRSAELLKLCLKHSVRPRMHWDLDADKDLLQFIDSHAPELKTTLSQQRPPALTIEREVPEGEQWKADDAQKNRTFLSFAVPPLVAETAGTSRVPSRTPEKKAASVSKIIFDITSHDQGHSRYPHDHGTYHGGESVFFAEIANDVPTAEADSGSANDTHDQASVMAQEDNTRKARPRIVQNVHADSAWKRHVVVWERGNGEARAELAEWFEGASEGRVVRVVAQGGLGWENWVRRVVVRVWVD